MALPIENLVLRIVEIEECPHDSPAPSGDRPEGACNGENALGAATLNGCAAEAPLEIGKLNGVNINSHDAVMSGKSDGSAASGSNAEDASARLERAKLNFSVLIHGPE